jgi:hypothetical protein
VTSGIKPDTDLSDNSPLKSVNISLLNSNSISQESIPHFKSATALEIYDRNTCGLRYKLNELIGHLDQNLPEIFCFSEHHLKHMESESLNIPNYKLWSYYYRNTFMKGGVSTFVENNLKFSTVNLNSYCIDKDLSPSTLYLKSCAPKLNFLFTEWKEFCTELIWTPFSFCICFSQNFTTVI